MGICNLFSEGLLILFDNFALNKAYNLQKFYQWYKILCLHVLSLVTLYYGMIESIQRRIIRYFYIDNF
jgi:hypothetical protein